MPDDILTDEQRAAVQPVMEAAEAYREGRGWWCGDCETGTREHRESCVTPRLAITVALALAEARLDVVNRQQCQWDANGRDACGEWVDESDHCLSPRCHAVHAAEAECTRLREALGE